MRAFVLKFPLCFAYSRESVSNSIERFRQLCFTRDEWVRSYQHYMTPSLMAYFLKDATDQLLRLEYLASTGRCVHVCVSLVGVVGVCLVYVVC